jgi:WD40 repeat protein
MNFKLIKKINQHSGSLYAVNYWKSKNLLLTGGADKIVASWDLSSFENTPFSIKTNSAILALEITPDEKFLFIGLFNGNFHVIDLQTRAEVKFIPFHKTGLFAISYSDENKRLILGSGDGTYSVWDTQNFTLLDKGKLAFGKIRAIQQHNGKAVLGTSEGNIVEIDLQNFKVKNLFQLENNNSIFSMLYYPNKKVWLVATKSAFIHAINLEQQKEIFSFPAHNWPVYKMEWIDNNFIATCSRDKTIKIWNAQNLEIHQRLEFNPHKSHTHSINNLLYISSLKRLISIGDDKSICIWEKQS